VTEAVLDASVVLKWFGRREERHADAARAVRSAEAAGAPLVTDDDLVGRIAAGIAVPLERAGTLIPSAGA
jgi:hypothetical protein